jgi:uncharacterized membrane-anchored protein YitT (DUF2179 family)
MLWDKIGCGGEDFLVYWRLRRRNHLCARNKKRARGVLTSVSFLGRFTMARHIRYYAQLLLGSAVYAAGFSFFLYPNGLVTGGITGVSTIINFLTGFPVGIMMIIINIPIFILGFWKLGLKFMLDSAASMLLISVLVDILHPYAFPVTEDPILTSCSLGLAGTGFGACFFHRATTGGTDNPRENLPAQIPACQYGKVVLMLDAVVIGAYALIFKNYDKSMFSVNHNLCGRISWIIRRGPVRHQLRKLVYIYQQGIR